MRKLHFLVLATVLLFQSQVFADVYVVTSKNNGQVLNVDTIKAIYTLQKKSWDDGKPIVVTVPEIASPEGQVFLEKVYGFSQEKYKKFWLEKVFQGETVGPPDSKSGAVLKDFIKSYQTVIGILPGSLVDDSMNKLKLD